MDFFAPVTFLKASLARNPIVVIADPVVLAPSESRVDLRYYLQLKIQRSFQSSEFKDLSLQEASEKPIPVNSTSSPGAFFEIQTKLYDELRSNPPVYSQTGISICPDLTRQFFYTIERWKGEELVDMAQSSTAWAIRSGISMRHYDMYKEIFFDKYIGAQGVGRFLTWQPDHKLVREDQPERLYFLTNFSPSPKTLLLRVRLRYSDNTYRTFTARQIGNVTPMTVYSFPVGFAELGLQAEEKTVISYNIWVCQEDTLQVSETRNFRIDRAHHESVRYILFRNGLGAYDTLRCIGAFTESVAVVRQTLERFTDYDYLPTMSDVLINDVTGERQITLNVGNWLSAKHREYLEDLLLSDEFFIVDQGEFVPLVPTFSQLLTDSKMEWPITRTLSFAYANPIGSYSRLPKITPPFRPTSWRQYATSCELDANGLRTGRRIVNELVKYYLDNGELVRPIVTKANIAGSEGYIDAWETSDCALETTPFINVPKSKVSTYKRSSCTNGYVGSTWTIIIPAGTYGSEVSQADADAKASAAIAAQDTQGTADLKGSCIPAVNIPLALHNLTPGDRIGHHDGWYYPLGEIRINGAMHIPNTSGTNAPEYNGLPRYATNGLPAGTYNIDVVCTYSNPEIKPYRLSIPSKSLTSEILIGNKTYRFANVQINWGDPDFIVEIRPA